MKWKGETAILSSREIEYLTKHGAARRADKFNGKRWDGSPHLNEADFVDSVAAEYVGTRRIGVGFDDTVYVGGDGGKDCLFRNRTVEISRPRRRDYAVITVAAERWYRHADIYVAVTGTLRTGEFVVRGYITHDELKMTPVIDFGYGRRWAARYDELRPCSELFERF